MPKRSNVFQETVAIIQTHFSGEATVTESGILTDRLTGQEREVDVVVEGTLGMNPVIVGIEATAIGRPATVEWVEQLIEKHRHLPTDRLVIVSENGFTAPGLKLALAKGVSAVYPQELTSDEADRTVATALHTARVCVHGPLLRRLGPQGQHRSPVNGCRSVGWGR